jgi:hypothetical protein
MANQTEYEQVPDVETGVIPEPVVDPRETYPQAALCKPSYWDTWMNFSNYQIRRFNYCTF